MLMVVLLISRYVAGQIAIYEKIEEDSEKQKFETVVQKMGDGTIVCTPDWKINSINPSAQKYLNISNIKDINLLDLIYARYSPTIPKEQLSDTSKPRKAFDLIRKESKDFKALYLGAGLDILKDPNGEITNIVLTLRDITQERTEELLKQNFLSLISHKLKTPVTVIREDAAMLNEGVAGNLSDKQKKITSAILEKSYALSGLMERLFGFTTVTGGKLDLSKETVELKSYLPMLINPILSLAKEKKVELNIDCPDKDTKVDMNRVYFDLMIGELIENALKFNDKDAVKVDVGVKKVKEKVEISVSDNGRGIPPEEREKIFEKFYQIDKYFTGNIEGVGLGLSVVKRLVTACGGSIQLESEMGKGSKFTIIL